MRRLNQRLLKRVQQHVRPACSAFLIQPCQRGESLSFHGMNNEQQAELERLERVLAVAQRNGNEFFIQNIEREIAAVQRGECSPLIEEYLTEEERTSRGVEKQTGA